MIVAASIAIDKSKTHLQLKIFLTSTNFHGHEEGQTRLSLCLLANLNQSARDDSA
ncbi:hypothetical protein [Noviherbaspirillum sp.]|uniref:hypothetical protein n=1 Tax=Noviherbaspirillum sp. TaxID=1926288 RepID=UPI002FE000E5